MFAIERGQVLLTPLSIQGEIRAPLTPDQKNCGRNHRDRHDRDNPSSLRGSIDDVPEAPTAKQYREKFKGRFQPVEMKRRRNTRQHQEVAPGLSAEIEQQPD